MQIVFIPLLQIFCCEKQEKQNYPYNSKYKSGTTSNRNPVSEISSFLELQLDIMKSVISILFLTATSVVICDTSYTGTQIVSRLYKDCNKEIGISVCLKKKLITLLDRLGRMENVTLVSGINIVRKQGVNISSAVVAQNNLSRAVKDDSLSYVLLDKFIKYIGSRNLEISFPMLDTEKLLEEGK